jgi:hypothetical protein
MIETRPRPTVADLLAQIESLTAQAVRATARQAQFVALAGEDPAEHYRSVRAQLGGVAMLACRELKALATHRHDWNDDDYCNACGADGRA